MLAYIGLLSAIILLTVIGNTSALASPAFTNGACSQAAQMRREVPKAITLAYCNWNQADAQVLEAVRNGVNVLVWFSVNIAKNDDGECFVQGGPDMKKVGKLMRQMREEGFVDVVHLMSIGGWNSPHPDTSFSAETMFDTLDKWNGQCATVAGIDYGSGGLFDGFDWDVEGNDDFDSPYNTFTKECIETMGLLSQLLKKEGYVVAMAPAESYLDPTTSEFSLRLNHNHLEWEETQPDFLYHGRNIYGYLLAKYGKTILPDSSVVETFDFVTIQLYEGYSHAFWKIRMRPEGVITPAEQLTELLKSLKEGWTVDFHELQFGKKRLRLDPQRVVIGLANGWAGEPENKFLYLTPDELQDAHTALVAQNLRPRGLAFWCIAHEGDKDTFLASTISSIQNKVEPSY